MTEDPTIAPTLSWKPSGDTSPPVPPAQPTSALRTSPLLVRVNGDCGTLTGIGCGTLSVELDRGAQVELPDSCARDGELERGYASTAHLAQSEDL